jgi:ribosomal protein S18 acetylase RimI-like enzyme
MSIPTPQPLPAADLNIRLLPANQFTIEELTEAYNRTRVDYMVPMPMNAARLAAYVKVYDVDMDRSWVALNGSEMLGLAMLGVRPGRTWITRLGVIPDRRRHGTGEALTQALLNGTRELGRPLSILEVIKGNTPAHTLFRKVGFQETRELTVLRRPPGPPKVELGGKETWLEQEEPLDYLCLHPDRPAWTNELESFINAGDAQGLAVNLESAGRGWMIFRRQKFMLSHFILFTDSGDPETIGTALLAHLYNRYPLIDSYIENVPVDDLHLPALLRAGFFEAFRRVEMHLANIES